ncbi:glycosyltransferase family 4 protein [Tolypothrix bouteillei]|uniref:Glycosyltransferase family 4 protein n=1 Tax=Tolypothrix bouteillei VB521301 TaxID=1479485 RepID=A0A8S9T5U9_9CYAN|nr:glycosyltransferase family 4 protein [Tolypothrix bouteillei]KAF3886899.1 glycosyltransferase family 4 protein [Tolypothrix bouteillei VB521301]
MIFSLTEQKFIVKGQKYYWFSTTVKEEIKGLRRADLILSIQKDEEKYFQNLIGNKVITVGHTVSLRQPRYISEVRQKILFVASNNDTNIHGINYFIHEVFPKVRIKLHDVQLLIAGNICDVIQDDEDLIKLGYVNNLNDIYDTSDIVINPILFGTGLKIKTIEALGQSKVLITTPEGAKGLERGDKKAFLIANDSEEFAEFLIETLTNLVLSRNLSNNAYSFAKNYNEELFHPLEKYLNNNISPSIEKNENNICHI